VVRVRDQAWIGEDGHADVRAWLAQLPLALETTDAERVASAAHCAADAVARPGRDLDDWCADSDCLLAGLETAQILAELQVSADCLIAGLLYRAVREERLPLDRVEERFGSATAQLLEGVLRMAAVSDLRKTGDERVLGQADAQRDNLRKMLVAIVDDVRVALIKLAERTCAIRAVKNDRDRREPIAREVFDVYAPLAHRLGIGHLKWELEDLSFRYLHPDAYGKIARLLDGKRRERDLFIRRVSEQLQVVLHNADIQFEISGRAKHIYSIWRKMQRKGIGFSQVYDIRAVRLLVPGVSDCYATLGLVHGLWRNIPNEFDDYIANPKENGYRSLHTAVIGPEGKILEVQIRTFQMHEEAELGVCAHWRYKGSDPGRLGSSYDEKIAWLRQVLDWHEEGDAEVIAEELRAGITQDRVYAFTPKGDVVSLAAGATPLDFAYHVHTEVGHRCRGAKVNGQIVPLTYALQTGDRVEILTGRQDQPRRDWLQPGLGYLRTSRARAKVQQWFKSQAREENIDAGRQLLEREFRRMALTSVDCKRIAAKVQQPTVEDMYAAVGAGDLSSSTVVNAAQDLVGDRPQPKLRVATAPGGRRGRGGKVEVQGVGNLLTHMAGCCKPLPGDRIVGYITQGRGVSVHRADCQRVMQFQEEAPQRIIDVDWGAAEGDRFEVDLAIEAYDRQGLLRDVTALFANARINVLAINTLSNKNTHTATMQLTVEISDLGSLAKLLERLNRLKNVISAARLDR